MYSAWTKNLKDPEDIIRFQNTVHSAKPVLDRLIQLIEEEEKALERSETDIRIFDLPNWAERQAFKNGCRSYMNTIKKLIDLDQQRNN
jgi:hypothetical protein